MMKGRVRLQALDDIAESQYELQLQAYNEGLANQNPGTPASRLKPDLLEVQRIYQVDWAQRLELPWQPTSMKFRTSALTCDEQIEAAYEIVINKESRRGYLPKNLAQKE
nr:NEL-type E3 ubiquitin ligase domain-containing protein [Pseudomonas weihenstephanensis]